jgi:chemotaxis protein MotA
MQELILEGVSGIVEGLNPRLIRSKLEAYTHQAAGGKAAKPAKPPKDKTTTEPEPSLAKT